MSAADLYDHLAGGVTHTCTCWAVTRRDGVTFGFTDHDRPLRFEGHAFQPEGGMTARALSSSVGLSVNNTAALGVLSSAAIEETDILAGRYDGAEVMTWRVRWDDVDARVLQFRGTMGEITRGAGGFEAELHGLTDALNQPQGRSYLTSCSAILGDAACGFDLDDPAVGFAYDLPEEHSGQMLVLEAPDLTSYADGWFVHGICEVVTGAAKGMIAAIKGDQLTQTGRQLTLWSEFAVPLPAGSRLRVVAGCDKHAKTCVEKFSNLLNFQGFPDIPGEDWLVSAPRSDQANTGGSRIR
ncbi:DUF2163 domain-containing protein [Yoonia sp.]|uniref:DUF2163 domain-containing protein n=1 Tax=Yoonia sp. TaxID=2212373 RepID=UPI0035C7EAD2